MLLIQLIIVSCPWGGSRLQFLAHMRQQIREPGVRDHYLLTHVPLKVMWFLAVAQHQSGSLLFKILALSSLPPLVYLADHQPPVF